MILFAFVPGIVLTVLGVYLVTLGGVAAINGSVLLLIGVVCLLISYATYRGGRGHSYLMQHGVPGTATVVRLEETRSRINEDPVVKLTLDVVPDGLAPFEATLRAGISPLRLPYVTPGSDIAVKVDSARPGRFLIDWAATMARPRASL